ncbi:hypothetical protein EGW08_021650 [Elysia chlorotica]|uniref:Uncharacterized protein n=1 Tax=Elysia chlorotica TaxID=188477 RepID=A0A3S0Z6Q8_ELYCH|nr:hypothetical protein EGW08_021650 [Elysia chlorotica]
MPKAKARKTAQNSRRRRYSKVVTDTPNRDEIAARKAPKIQLHKNNALRKAKRSIFELSQGSSDSEDLDVHEVCSFPNDIDEVSDEGDCRPAIELEEVSQVNVDDYILCRFATKKTLKFYIARVIEGPDAENDLQSVRDYFMENWWSKRHLWAACCNTNVIKLNATTTNTLESYHGKIKKVINEKQSLSTALSSLISFDNSKISERERLFIIASNSDVYDHRDQDEVSQRIPGCLSGFGAELVKHKLFLLDERVDMLVLKHLLEPTAWVYLKDCLEELPLRFILVGIVMPMMMAN